jgi:hypothetical protein
VGNGALPVWLCFTGGLLPGGRGAGCRLSATRVRIAGLRSAVATLIACGGAGVAGIGQLADVAGRRGRDDGGVEIRIVLDRAEPPAGRLRVVRAPGRAPAPRTDQEIGFTGWLGLLRALYEVTAGPGEGARPGP